MRTILIKDVSKSFGETRALTNACLEAMAGEVHAIVGENGSGKSTLAKIISGVLAPDTGIVEVLGTAPNNPRKASRMGVAPIFQEMMLAEELSVATNIFVGSDGFFRKKMSEVEKNKSAKLLVERLSQQEIDPTAKVSTLPLYMKQWIVLARAIRSNPKVVILDESSAALDMAGTERLHDEIRRMRKDSVCIVIVTHRIAELVKIADRATVLRDGETVGTLAKSEITEKNLLRLMSAEKSRSVEASGAKRTASFSTEPRLRCCEIQLEPNAAPFDFAVGQGQVVGVTGLDGAGQAEFIAAISGIHPAASGYVEMRDSSGRYAPVRSVRDADVAGVRYVSGDRKKDGIFPALSAFENFGMALYGRHRTRFGLIDFKSLRETFQKEIRRLSIKVGAPNNRITSLSGGNQQKVLIARALAADPKLIVLNDPARGVDIGTKQELYRQLAAFAARGGSVVYLSSEIEEFLHFADRVDVFVNASLNGSFSSGNLTEESLLYAMFGHRKQEHVTLITGEVA